jgi:hypothetical protein
MRVKHTVLGSVRDHSWRGAHTHFPRRIRGDFDSCGDSLSRWGAIILLAYPGMIIGVDGRACIDPEQCASTFQALASAPCERLYRLIEPGERIEPGDSRIRQDAMHAKIVIGDFPIQDYSVPSASVCQAIWEDKPARDHLWANGSGLALHCHAGAGRSGLVAALLLAEQGLSIEAAIIHVRQYHAEAIETEAQTAWLQSTLGSLATGV